MRRGTHTKKMVWLSPVGVAEPLQITHVKSDFLVRNVTTDIQSFV